MMQEGDRTVSKSQLFPPIAEHTGDKKFVSCICTSHSAYVATSNESDGLKIDGFFYPNLM